jgi:hypothetical protein
MLAGDYGRERAMIAARQIAFGRGAWKRKPYDAEIEYLESTGTQYIDTGVFGNSSMGYETKFSIETDSQFLFGAWNDSSHRQGIYVSNTWLVYCGNGGTNNSVIGISAGEICTASLSNGVITVNGRSRTFTDSTVMGRTFYIFGNNRPNIIDKAKSGTRFWYFKMWDEKGVLIRDLIPVRKGNIGYMYDRVSGQLFGNQGTGEFVLGDDI